MKVLAVADIHGKKDKLQLIADHIKRHQPDHLVIAGDIINYFNADKTLAALSNLSIPVLAVRGNSDPKSIQSKFTQYPSLTNLHLNQIELNQISFVGIGGAVPIPFHSKVKLFERGLLDRLRGMLTPESVLIAHPPPKGTKDKVVGKFAAGSKGLTQLVREVQPKMVICGHIHEDTGVGTLENTLVVNCSIGADGKGALIEFPDIGEPKIQML